MKLPLFIVQHTAIIRYIFSFIHTLTHQLEFGFVLFKHDPIGSNRYDIPSDIEKPVRWIFAIRLVDAPPSVGRICKSLHWMHSTGNS